jgi:hypothetical protein
LNLDANPFPQNAVWFFNGQPLPVISGIELGVNFIRIQMVTELDSGIYTVQASNAVGTGMISFMLQVEGTKFIDYNITIIMITMMSGLLYFA